jgi:hypothetical protein
MIPLKKRMVAARAGSRENRYLFNGYRILGFWALLGFELRALYLLGGHCIA